MKRQHTIEQLCDVNPSKIPAWATGTVTDELTDYPYECHALYRNGDIIGYVYDDGQGYQFAEGRWNIPERGDEE